MKINSENVIYHTRMRKYTKCHGVNTIIGIKRHECNSENYEISQNCQKEESINTNYESSSRTAAKQLATARTVTSAIITSLIAAPRAETSSMMTSL